jgi:predicted nucleic acid-binding protein
VTIVDASVAVKWFIEEAGTEVADGLADGGNLAAPALIRIEVAGAISRKVRIHEIDPREAELAVGEWFQSIADGVVALLPDEDYLLEAFRLALALGHALQDCLYLAAAKHHGAPLVTADAKFAAKARASYPNIRLLSEL